MSEPHTKDTLIRDLRALGLSRGDGVWMHASMKSIGLVSGGAHTVIEALLEVVGDDGLLGMPGFSDDAYLPDELEVQTLSPQQIKQAERAVPGFDIDRSPTAGMGVLAETFRTWPGTRRSAHASTSVCIHGSDAEHIVAPHDASWAMGPNSPFGRMRHRHAMKILLIGVGWNRCTPLHTAENYGTHKRIKIRRFKSGPGDALWFETPDVADDVGRLFPSAGEAFEAAGMVTQGVIGDADVRICGFDDLIRFAAPWISARNQESGARH